MSKYAPEITRPTTHAERFEFITSRIAQALEAGHHLVQRRYGDWKADQIARVFALDPEGCGCAITCTMHGLPLPEPAYYSPGISSWSQEHLDECFERVTGIASARNFTSGFDSYPCNYDFTPYPDALLGYEVAKWAVDRHCDLMLRQEVQHA